MLQKSLKRRPTAVGIIIFIVAVHIHVGRSLGGLSPGRHVQRDGWVKAAWPASYTLAFDTGHYYVELRLPSSL